MGGSSCGWDDIVEWMEMSIVSLCDGAKQDGIDKADSLYVNWPSLHLRRRISRQAEYRHSIKPRGFIECL